MLKLSNFFFFTLIISISLAHSSMSTNKPTQKTALDRIKENFIGDIPVQIKSFISYLEHHQEYLDNNIETSKNVLIHGESGSGKKHLFNVITHEFGLPSISLSATIFAGESLGEATVKIHKIFEEAQKTIEPFVIFINHLDMIDSKKAKFLISALTNMQDFSDNKNVFIMLAAEDLESLDPSLRDRFPATCHITRLNQEQREEFIMKLFKNNDLNLDAELAKRLAEATEKYQYSYKIDSEKHIFTDRQKKSWKDCSYSNRDIEYIIKTANARQFTDCKINKKNCDKNLCAYFADVMSKMGKSGEDVKGKRIINCDNLK